ncbi:hypothetical protein [Leuconostoc sp. MTCC 10508]|uniref:hypothetical protein n=1 Tax=Leuconostoc sp. MTCC 10508 TaxID=2698683 RepID=UPI0020C037DE|nr:hypothetical protein [Leuconostoc sp. MTCC 10508]
MRKRVMLWTLLGLGTLVFVFIISIFLSKENQMPYYEKTGHHVILSDKVNRLKSSNDKEKVFALARKALVQKTKDEGNIDWDNFEDVSLYIEKIDKNHQYYFGYTIKSTNPMVLTIRYDMIIKLNKNSIKTSNFEVIDFSMKFVN